MQQRQCCSSKSTLNCSATDPTSTKAIGECWYNERLMHLIGNGTSSYYFAVPSRQKQSHNIVYLRCLSRHLLEKTSRTIPGYCGLYFDGGVSYSTYYYGTYSMKIIQLHCLTSTLELHRGCARARVCAYVLMYLRACVRACVCYTPTAHGLLASVTSQFCQLC